MMRDRETPEADMMRDQSGVDAAPGLFGPKSRTRVSIPITPARPLTPRWTTWPGGRSRRPGAALVRRSDHRIVGPVVGPETGQAAAAVEDSVGV